jgi:hypothetical protein
MNNSKSILEHFIGYDTAVMNWLISLYHGKGFLYSVATKEVLNLNYAAEFLHSTEVSSTHLAAHAHITTASCQAVPRGAVVLSLLLCHAEQQHQFRACCVVCVTAATIT